MYITMKALLQQVNNSKVKFIKISHVVLGVYGPMGL